MAQWWYECGFLSNTLIALSYSCSMGFRFEAQANDQFVKQYSMWDRVTQWRDDFAALTVKQPVPHHHPGTGGKNASFAGNNV